MRVKIGTNEWYPVYEEWNEYGRPEFDVDIPDELWNEYLTAIGNFNTALNKLKTFLNDD